MTLVLIGKDLCFGVFKHQNRGQTGARYIYIYIYINSHCLRHDLHRNPMRLKCLFFLQALEAVQKNPRLLTIPDFEYQRTNPSLESWQHSGWHVVLYD